MPKIEFTESQIKNLIDFFDYNFIKSIRDDIELDSIAYVVDMCDIYRKLQEAKEG